jgi:adenylosuccinate lyase
MHLDQISEHQRDLTNSASQRYTQELLVVFDYCVRKLRMISARLVVDRTRMRENFMISADNIIAEPLYILLSYYGHPDAHEYVRRKSFQAYEEKKTLRDVIEHDDEILAYVRKFSREQKEKVFDAEKYVGVAAERAERVADYWEGVFKTDFFKKSLIKKSFINKLFGGQHQK